MLGIKFVRENADLVRKNIERKQEIDRLVYLDNFLQLDEDWRKVKKEIDTLRHSRNSLSESINKAKKEGKDVKPIIAEAKEIPAKIKLEEEKIEKIEADMKQNLSQIPNIMHESVPVGKDDTENKVIKEWGEKKDFAFPVKNHVELLEELGLADFDRAADISGNGFYVLKGDLAMLNQALIQFTLQTMAKKKYVYVEPPLMIRKRILSAAMDVEGFKDSIYSVQDDDLHMIGTSEHALLGLHEDEAILEQDLPKKYYSYSMCFRKEIGSHGINEKGLWRTHQFNKIEQFIFCAPEESYKFYDELQANSEELFQALGLPYRIVECCTGDLALWKAKSSDIEVWRPTTKDYGEVTSLTNCTAYQAEGVNTKIVRKNGDRELLHTLNNTAVATSRALVAIIENYQNVDGSIDVPKVLQPFMLGKKKLEPLK